MKQFAMCWISYRLSICCKSITLMSNQCRRFSGFNFGSSCVGLMPTIPIECNAIYTSFLMLQIFIWRPCKTRATLSIKPWGWEAWGPCSAAFMHAAALTASLGPHIMETAALHKVLSEARAVFGSRCRDESRIELTLSETRHPNGVRSSRVFN